MKTLFRKILVFFLLGAFIVASDPGHFIHLLAHHNDTEEVNTGDKAALSTEHIHCETLNFSLSPFLKLATPATSQPAVCSVERVIVPGVFVTEGFRLRASGRAPPACS